MEKSDKNSDQNVRRKIAKANAEVQKLSLDLADENERLKKELETNTSKLAEVEAKHEREGDKLKQIIRRQDSKIRAVKSSAKDFEMKCQRHENEAKQMDEKNKELTRQIESYNADKRRLLAQYTSIKGKKEEIDAEKSQFDEAMSDFLNADASSAARSIESSDNKNKNVLFESGEISGDIFELQDENLLAIFHNLAALHKKLTQNEPSTTTKLDVLKSSGEESKKCLRIGTESRKRTQVFEKAECENKKVDRKEVVSAGTVPNSQNS